MAYICGSVEQLSLRTISWNLNCAKLPMICLSNKFTVFGDKYYEFFFRLFNFSQNSSSLDLCQLKAISLQLNMHVILYYQKESKDFSLINFRVTGISNELTTIKTDGLMRISCNFSNIGEINGLVRESGKNILFSVMMVSVTVLFYP